MFRLQSSRSTAKATQAEWIDECTSDHVFKTVNCPAKYPNSLFQPPMKRSVGAPPLVLQKDDGENESSDLFVYCEAMALAFSHISTAQTS